MAKRNVRAMLREQCGLIGGVGHTLAVHAEPAQ